jgi:hypothetical protein
MNRKLNYRDRLIKGLKRKVLSNSLLFFLVKGWKFWVSTSLIGATIAMINFWHTPASYQATAYFTTMGPGLIASEPTFETPAQIIMRLSNPDFFGPTVLGECGLGEETDAANRLLKVFKVTPVPNVTNWAQIFVVLSSPQEAISCTNAIFKVIKDRQDEVLDSFIKLSKLKIEENNKRIQKAQSIVAKADKFEGIGGAVYLATRDEIRYLIDENAKHERIIASKEAISVHFVDLPYVTKLPPIVRLRSLLAGGIIYGFLLGILLYLIYIFVKKDDAISLNPSL